MSKTYKFLLGFVGVSFLTLALSSPHILTAIREKQVLERTFAKYGSALVREEYETAYEFCGPDFKAVISLGDFIGQHKDLRSQFGELEPVVVKSLTISFTDSPERGTALITSDLRFERKTIELLYEFRYMDGQWLLFGYKQSE